MHVIEDDITIDDHAKSVSRGGKTIRPSKQVFELIKYLHENGTRVCHKEEIMDHLGISMDAYQHGVPCLVKKARKELRKLGIQPIGVRYLMGYYWGENSKKLKSAD